MHFRLLVFMCVLGCSREQNIQLEPISSWPRYQTSTMPVPNSCVSHFHRFSETCNFLKLTCTNLCMPWLLTLWYLFLCGRNLLWPSSQVWGISTTWFWTSPVPRFLVPVLGIFLLSTCVKWTPSLTVELLTLAFGSALFPSYQVKLRLGSIKEVTSQIRVLLPSPALTLSLPFLLWKSRSYM